MRKFLCSAILISFAFAGNSFAQSNSSATDSAQKTFLYVHGLYSIIVDHTTDIRYHEGAGGEAGVGFLLTNRKDSLPLYFVASIGYTSFAGLADTIKTEGYMPVRLGFRQFLLPHLLYLNADAGAGFITNPYATYKTPSPAKVTVSADLGVGIITKAGFEAALNVDAFKEPSPDGWTGCVVIKAGWRFGL